MAIDVRRADPLPNADLQRLGNGQRCASNSLGTFLCGSSCFSKCVALSGLTYRRLFNACVRSFLCCLRRAVIGAISVARILGGQFVAKMIYSTGSGAPLLAKFAFLAAEPL